MAEDRNLYETLQQMLADDFAIPKETSSDEGYSKLDYFKLKIKAYFKTHYKVMLVGLGLFIVIAHMIYQLIQLGLSMYYVDAGFLVYIPAYYVIWLCIPFIIWGVSTLYDYWNYHNRKMAMLTMCILNVGVILGHFLYNTWCILLLPFFVRFPTSNDITVENVFNLARLVLAGLTVLLITLLMSAVIKNLYSTMTKRAIIKFKLGRNLDLRKNVKFSYDMQIVDNLETGKPYTIKEKDRSLHALGNGTTGTGKTTSLFTVAIAHDMDKIVHNITYQKKRIESYLKKGQVRMIDSFADDDFNLDKFEVVKGDKEVLEKLKFFAPIAGITAMAPNSSFSDEIYKLAKNKGLKINRLDPTLTPDGKLKEGFVGFNPLYINPKLTKLEWMMEVSRKAVLFADVIQAVFEANGTSDVYFASLNKNITTAVTMLVILTYPDLNNGKQPTPGTVQDVLNDFNKAKPYRDMLITKYGKKNAQGFPIKEKGKADVGPFQTVLEIIDSEIIGEGAEKIFDQARGLRIIINTVLNNPLIKNILCNENTIDLDNALKKGEITVVNYALEFGQEGTAFGLFFLLSYINAVFRRPGNEKTRLPHFFYIDELPVLLHPRIEACFSLFRQYRVAMFVAIQSLSQVKKKPSTVFLKDVMLGNCAHHFVFGRVAPEEMELYQTLAGTEYQITEMKGVSESSLTVPDPTISFSSRETMKRENVADGGDIRNQDFQEVFVITVDNGSPVPAFFGKVSFLPDTDRIKLKKLRVKWENYYKKQIASKHETVNDIVVAQTDSVTDNKEVKPADEVPVTMIKDFAMEKATDLYNEKGITFTLSAGRPSSNEVKNEEATVQESSVTDDGGFNKTLEEVMAMDQEIQSIPNSYGTVNIDVVEVMEDGSFNIE